MPVTLYSDPCAATPGRVLLGSSTIPDVAALWGRVVLVVTLAAGEPDADRQMRGIQALRAAHPTLCLIGVPSNSFVGNEPKDSGRWTRETAFDVVLPACSVRGPNTHPLIRALVNATCLAVGGDFVKFLIGRRGAIQRFGCNYDPANLEGIVRGLLSEPIPGGAPPQIEAGVDF